MEGTLLIEGLDPDVVDGRGLEGTSIGRGLEGLDSDVVAGWRLEGTLDVVVDCSD